MRRASGGHGFFAARRRAKNGVVRSLRRTHFLFFRRKADKMQDMIRYSVITEKNPREIVLLRGTGCAWKRCTFCDYHLDCCPDEAQNFALNRAVLERVTGQYGRLEVINSGSFCELDAPTMDEIARVCQQKGIAHLHFECHWMHRGKIAELRARFAAIGVQTHLKIGVETFDRAYREDVLHKGIGVSDPAEIAAQFDECCLLFGLSGQTADSMRQDIQTGLTHFDRVCVNVMVKNTTPVLPDPDVIAVFCQQVAPHYVNDPRVDILMENTDFGVGGAAQ